MIYKSKLKDFNISFYAMIMGFVGFSLASYKLIEVFSIEYNYSIILLYFSFISFVIVNILYLYKMFTNFGGVKQDFYNNVRSNFFPGIGKILLLLSIGFLNYNQNFAKNLWILGVVIQSIFTIILFRRWILHRIDIKELNPLWFLPIVGNMIIPISGIKLGFTELSFFFFSVGFIMWIVLFTILLNRLIFHIEMPEKLLPTLFILIAPPSIGFISITTINLGNITDFGKMLYYFGLFLFIIMISKINILLKLKFYLSWWAYSFPISALTIATFLLYIKNQNIFFKYLGVSLYVFLVIIIVILLIKTLIGIYKNNFCIEE